MRLPEPVHGTAHGVRQAGVPVQVGWHKVCCFKNIQAGLPTNKGLLREAQPSTKENEHGEFTTAWPERHRRRPDQLDSAESGPGFASRHRHWLFDRTCHTELNHGWSS